MQARPSSPRPSRPRANPPNRQPAAEPGDTRGPEPEVPTAVYDIFLRRLQQLESRVADELARPASPSSAIEAFVLDAGREFWTSATAALRMLARPAALPAALAGALAAGRSDELGVDYELAQTVRELVRPLGRLWLGLREQRSAALPASGGVLITLNRSAWPLPVEAVVLWAFLGDGRAAGRPVYALWDKTSLEAPFVGDWLQKVGIFAADEDNCRVLLERGAVVIAFPEGEAADAKTYDRRYRLERFADRGLIAAAMGAGARIVPAALIGNEESFPLLGRIAGFPITATFPLAGLLGLLPLPLRWTLRLGSVIEYARGDADDIDPAGIVDAVRARMQALLGELLAERDSIISG